MPTATLKPLTTKQLRVAGVFRRIRCDQSTLPVVEKDILKVGTWHVVDENGDRTPWNVTHKTLLSLCQQFKRCRSAGNRIPWIEDHEGGAGQRVGDVVGLRISGNDLIARCQVTDRKYRASYGAAGENTSQEVSVEVQENWMDGAGNVYPIALTHLANVINPVVTGQKPFKRVLSLRKPKRIIRMADETKPGNSVDGEGTGGNIAFANVVAMLEKYFEVTVPDSVTDEPTLDAFLAGLITTPGEEVAEEETPAEDVTGGDLAGIESSPMYMSLKRKLDSATKRLALVEKSEKDAFHSEVESLVTDNHLTPADGKEIRAEADRCKSYSLSLLKPYRRLAKNAVHLGGVAKQLGAGATEGGKSEEAEKAVKARQEQLMKTMF